MPKIVIIGGGIVGCGLADELTERGWRDVYVVEQGPLFAAGGSTSHAPGLVFQTNPSKTMTSFATYTVDKLSSLTLDGQWVFQKVGSIELARTPARLTDLARRHGYLESYGVPSRLIDPDECVRLSPLVSRDAVLGGYHVPTDGLAKPVRAAEAQARRAQERGARFLAEHTVTSIRVARGHVAAVVTDKGEIPAELVVCCAGIWGPRIGDMVGQPIPLLPLAHQYAKSSPIPALATVAASAELENAHPILREQDHDLYLREHVDRMGVGGYGHDPLPVDPYAIEHPADRPMPASMPFTPDDFAFSWQSAVELMPALADARIEEAFNGIFSFTPDGFPLMGESRITPGFWVAEAVWITHSAGVARSMAEWLVDGQAALDVHECDIDRFEPHQVAPSYVERRGRQNYIEVYDVIHPLQPMEDPRPIRTSPFYEREASLGACFLESSGWERPHWYEVNAGLLDRYASRVPSRDPWSARYWSPIAGVEALYTRDAVAMYDMTSLKRIEVSGPGALAYLEHMTTNRLDRPVGTVVYTLMLGDDGGIRSDLTIARLATDRFQIGANGNLDVAWLERRAPLDGSVVIRDTTSATCCIGLWGPRARDVLAGVASINVSNDAFRYFQARELFVDVVPVTALRLSYVGELGWELYTPADLGRKLWDVLWAAGEPHGVIAAGRSAFGSLRLEKGYRSWGTDMTTEHDPWQAGLGFAVKMDKGEFVGREALVARPAEPARRLSCLVLDDGGTVTMGKEPVRHDGRAVGYVTSGAFGYSVGESIAYAWLPAHLALPGTRVEVESFGVALPATVSAEPLFDPQMGRLRS